MGIISHFVPLERHTTRTLWPSMCVERGLSERPLPHFSHFFLQALKVFFCPSADRLCLRTTSRHAGGMQPPQCQREYWLIEALYASDITHFKCVTLLKKRKILNISWGGLQVLQADSWERDEFLRMSAFRQPSVCSPSLFHWIRMSRSYFRYFGRSRGDKKVQRLRL